MKLCNRLIVTASVALICACTTKPSSTALQPIVAGPADTAAPTADEASPVIPSTGAFTLPSTWTACASNDDCTIVTLGCCSETPVNCTHATAARKALQTSGRNYCAVKTACGPGRGGTWDSERGVCKIGTCQMPLVNPAEWHHVAASCVEELLQ